MIDQGINFPASVRAAKSSDRKTLGGRQSYKPKEDIQVYGLHKLEPRSTFTRLIVPVSLKKNAYLVFFPTISLLQSHPKDA